LIAGERDPVVLADLAKRRMRSRIPQLQRALAGRFGQHHAEMLRLHLAHIDHLDALIDRLDERIDAKLHPFADDLRRLQTITGVGVTTAQVLIAEIGVDMTAFPTAAHLASWCGVSPGNNQSAGKQRSGRTNPANPWLTDALVQAAWAASRSRDTRLAARFWRLARRIGKKKAIIATAHVIVVPLWHTHTERCDYTDLGIDWWDKRSSTANETARLKRRLEALGHRVTIEPAA
jgi:transposase